MELLSSHGLPYIRLNVNGLTVKFPSHPKRKTKTPHHAVRWIKRGSLWELSQKSV